MPLKGMYLSISDCFQKTFAMCTSLILYYHAMLFKPSKTQLIWHNLPDKYFRFSTPLSCPPLLHTIFLGKFCISSITKITSMNVISVTYQPISFLLPCVNSIGGPYLPLYGVRLIYARVLLTPLSNRMESKVFHLINSPPLAAFYHNFHDYCFSELPKLHASPILWLCYTTLYLLSSLFCLPH